MIIITSPNIFYLIKPKPPKVSTTFNVSYHNTLNYNRTTKDII